MKLAMNVLDLLLNRSSCGRLEQPLPNKEQLDVIFKSALRAPDHAGLTPWRFLVYEGQESLTKLGELFLEAKLKLNPELEEAQRNRTLSLPLRAPMVIVAIAPIQEHPKVPAVEQIVSCGCAVQAMLYALQAQGFAGYWRTGELASNVHLKELLGTEAKDEIVGFLYIGTPMISLDKPSNKNVEDFFEYR